MPNIHKFPDRIIKRDRAAVIARLLASVESLERMLDVLTINIPLLPETEHRENMTREYLLMVRDLYLARRAVASLL